MVLMLMMTVPCTCSPGLGTTHGRNNKKSIIQTYPGPITISVVKATVFLYLPMVPTSSLVRMAGRVKSVQSSFSNVREARHLIGLGVKWVVLTPNLVVCSDELS